VITKLLIANRGEIAARIIRTARAMNIAIVALYSDADRDAPYVSQSDESVHLPGTAPTDTYLRSDLVLEAATRTGADAAHPATASSRRTQISRGPAPRPASSSSVPARNPSSRWAPKSPPRT
jgi:biotin carboxylase